MANYVSNLTVQVGDNSSATYNIRELFPHVGTCSTAAATAAKEVTIGNFKLYTGAWVVVKFNNTNSAAVASLTLNVDGTGAKPIKYRNANLASASQLIANRYTYFIYDGTNYQIVSDFNSDTYDRTSQQTRIYAGTIGVFNYSLCAMDNNQRMQSFTTTSGTGTAKTFNTSASFIYPPVIMYNAANSTYADGTAIANNVLYEQYPSVDLRYSCNVTSTAGFTQYKPVYLECTINSDGTFKLTTTGLTQTFTNGKYYILLGCMYNTSIYQLALFAQHPMFYYDGTHLNGIVYTAAEKTKLSGIANGATKVESSSNGKIKINGTDTTVYSHPTHTAASSGLYKITVDTTGHVSATAAVAKADITALGIPGNDTDTKVTQSATTTTNYRPILFGANNSTDVSTLANTITDQAYTSTKMYAQPSTGLIFCTGRKIENVTIQTGSTKQAHITLQTLMTWLITTKTYIPSGQYCHVIISTTWAYANNDILQVSIDGTNYEIQLAGVIIEFIGDATSYNAGMFRLLIHSSPTIDFTATSGYSKFPVSTIAEYTCNGSDYSPTWKKIWNSHPTYTSKSSGLYKITVDGTGHVSAATAVAKGDIPALDYLPLSGGTMTGTLTAKASQYADEYSGALNMNNSNIYGVNSIYTADVADGAAEGIHFYRDATHVDTLWMTGGSLLFVPNRELGTNTTAANSQKVARFTANPTTGQVVITDGTTGGIKSSGYTIATSVPSGAVFTDQKVRQSATTTEDFRPILMGATHVSGSSTGLDATVTDEACVSTKLYCQPKTGNLYVAGDIKRSNNTLSLWSGNDCAGVSQRNNYDINTWYGFSVSNACTGAGTLNKVAFSVNARNGQAWHTGNVHLYSASGDSPALVFQRGTFVDNLNDWKIYVSGGALYFAQSTANASSETWTNKMYFHASDGNLYVGSTKVSLNGHTHNYAGSSSVGGAATSANALNLTHSNELNFSKLGGTGHVWFGYRWNTQGTETTGGATITTYKFGNANGNGGLAGLEAATSTFKSDNFGDQLIVERTGGANMAGITFKNTSGVLGYIAANTVNGDLYHYGATDTSTMKYTILDSHNYTSYPLPRNIKHVHTASGTEGTAGWVKIARITVTNLYANHPMTFTIAQRGIMQYRIHLVLVNNGSVAAAAISQFIIARDNSWTDTNNNPRAYIIKPSDGIFDLYIRKTEAYDHIFVVDFTKADGSEGDNYSVTWTNVHVAESAITGGTEAVKKLYLPTTTNYAGSSSVGGAATSANKLNTNAGATNRPVYFSGGVPVQCDAPESKTWFKGVPLIGTNGVMEIGKIIDFHATNTSEADYDYRIETSTTAMSLIATGSSNTLTIKSPGNTQLSFQTTSSGKAYTASGITCYPLGTSGMTALFNFGGNVVIGGGEAAKTLYDNDYDTIKTVEHETLYLASDSAELHLITDAQTYANRKVLRIIGGQLTKSGGSWIAARDHAPVYSYKGGDGTSGSFYPAIFSKSKTGGWAIGTIGNDDNFYVSYTTDAHYSSDTNTSTYTIQFPKDSGTLALTSSNITGTSSNVTGTVAIAHGGTGATTRLSALKALTEQGVGTNAQYFLTITQNWGQGGYTSVADAKTVLGLKSAAYTASTDYLSSSTKYAGSSSAGGAATSANILNKNNAAGATTTGVQYANGQLTVGTADGNAVEGSNASYKLWSYPAGGTAVGGGTANIQNLRLYWSTAYFRDIFLSPNNDSIYHRAVINNSAKPWYVLLDSNNLETYSLHTPDTAKALSTDTGKIMSPITRPQNLYNRSNKLALIPGSNITVEYSTDAGSNWTDMGLTADKKGDLFNDTISATIPIGPNNSTDRTTSMQTRITITCDGRDQMIDQYILWLDSAYQTISIDLQVAYGNATTTFTNIRTGLSCPPWIYQYILNTETKRFGPNKTSAYVNKIRFIIKYTSINSSYKTSRAIIHSIAGYSGIYWGGATKNNLMIYDHLYTWDNSQNATFPAQLNATGATFTSSSFGPLKIVRSGSTYSAGIKFYNNTSTYLGSLGINTANSRFLRWNTDESTSYEIIDRSIVRNNTVLGTLGWTSSSADTVIPTVNTIAFWNGAYSGTSSNLTYCKQGAFGTIVTKSTTDYSKVSISRNLTSGTKVGTITIDGTATDLYCQTNSDTKVTQNISSGSANLPLLMSYYQTGTATTAAQVVYRNDLIYANPSAGTITANKFYGDITGDGLNAGIYDLLNVDNPTFNGTEWMLTSIPSSSGGTSTPSFRRVKTAKFADYVSSTSRTVLFDQSDNTSKSISLSTPPTDTQYLKLYFKSSGNMGQPSVDNSVYSIAEVPYMTGVKLGGILQVAQSSDNQGVLRLTALAFTVDITTGNPYTLRLIKVSKASRISGSGVSDDSSLSANIIKVVAYR